MKLYADKQVLVLGLGESGLAMALWLARCGARVRVADTRETPDRLPRLREALPEVDFVPGEFAESLLEGVDIVAVSPGLSPLKELALISAAAARRAITVIGEIELFAQALTALGNECGYAPKVIAVTGTNGKTTVTRLTGLLCEKSGLRVGVAGNISPAALDMLRELLDEDMGDGGSLNDSDLIESGPHDSDLHHSDLQDSDLLKRLPQVWVLELSSFQLYHTCLLYTLRAHETD